ncbi:zinc-ribbon domain containing protein [Sutterella sp. KLE1602]|uniref:zinc-ribbon domain containing protein n=1 Tax=Sutterella sp. KLE1602 TaxID=1574262 RepID=UPI000AF95E53|nr:zinc-ribbon domain containing protein [Sutterella sp. KLE1602]
MTMQSLSTTTTELKPVELQSYLDEGWRIFVDTCSFMSSGCEPFFTRSAAALRDAGVSIHCPKEVRRELEKNLSSPKEQTRQLAMRGLAAYDALDKLDVLREIDCPGSQENVFADPVFAKIFDEQRAEHKLLLITQDRRLAAGLYSRNQDEFMHFHPVHVLRLLSRGDLGFLNHPQTQELMFPPNMNDFSRQSVPMIRAHLVSSEAVPPAGRSVPRTVSAGRTGEGGEGIVYDAGNGMVAKIYHADKCTTRREAKVRLLASRPIRLKGVCAPQRMLFSNGFFAGCLMPEAKGFGLEGPLDKCFAGWSRADLVQLAVTILKTIGSLHRLNVLVGDVNLSNIRIVSPDEAYLVDCDSVQVANLPCPVGHEMYTAPEIRGRDFSTFLRSKSSENHAVAALIFMLLMPDEDLDESGKYRLGARRISSDPFLLDYPGFHRGEPLTLCRRARIWSHLPDDLKSAFGRTFDSRGSLHAEADRLGVAGWILRLNAYRERLLDGTLLADDPLANEIYPKTGRKILPPARPACVVCGRPHDETDGRNGVCSACISIAERVLARTTVRAAGTPALSAPKTEPKASGPETAASEDKPSDTAYERTCVDCGSLFRITKGEAEHLRNLGYRLPARCKACRAERRARKKAIERRSDEDGSILDEILNGVRDLIKPLA